MDLHVYPNDPLLRIFHEGSLVGEIALAHLKPQPDLEKEVERARKLTAEHNILHNTICKVVQAPKGDDPYCQGLIAGMREEVKKHPMAGVPPICPNNNPRFVHGWQDGMFLRRISREMAQAD